MLYSFVVQLVVCVKANYVDRVNLLSNKYQKSTKIRNKLNRLRLSISLHQYARQRKVALRRRALC